MTVARMREDMPCDEYAAWRIYFGRKHQRKELELAKTRTGQKGR